MRFLFNALGKRLRSLLFGERIHLRSAWTSGNFAHRAMKRDIFHKNSRRVDRTISNIFCRRENRSIPRNGQTKPLCKSRALSLAYFARFFACAAVLFSQVYVWTTRGGNSNFHAIRVLRSARVSSVASVLIIATVLKRNFGLCTVGETADIISRIGFEFWSWKLRSLEDWRANFSVIFVSYLIWFLHNSGIKKKARRNKRRIQKVERRGSSTFQFFHWSETSNFFFFF